MKLFNHKNLLIFFFALASAASAQEQAKTNSSSELFPKKGDIGTSIIIDGLIDNISFSSTSNNYGQNILFVKYYIEEDIALRLGTGVSLNAFKRETADSLGVTLREVDSTSSQFLFNLSFGAEKHLGASSKRLDPFVFGQIDLTFIGKTNIEAEVRQSSSAGVSSLKRTIKRDGGIAFGLQVGGGMNYFLAQRFSIGAEFALQFQVVSEGGTISDNEVFTPINGSTTSDFTTREDKTTTTALNVAPNALINISYFF